MWPVWLWTQDPTLRIITNSYSGGLSIEHATKSKDIIEAIDAKFNTISSKDVEGSHMQIDRYRPVVVDTVEVNDKTVLELRGCWEVSTDYMGGSFTAYTIFDPATQRATVIIFALYAPEDIQRNLMRELEALIYTLE
jgi:hypothetical protein